MDLLQKNPFTTIKANDLDDSEINEQWVDAHGGFADYFLPTNQVTQYILGSKGSGKTHLMRYFSYNSQMIRNSTSILNGIKADGYFGVYFQASGLNGDRFEGLPFERNKKNALFEYFYELWCAGQIIEALININDKEPIFENEKQFCDSVLELFSRKTELFNTVENLLDLKKFLKELSNQVDYEVANAYFPSNSNLEILTARGALIFGIPKLLAQSHSCFENVTFLYLIDELENISEEQQVYLNTLLREKKLPISFRLGARSYGIKTFKTLGAGEENREGHEYEVTQLDDILSESEDYEDFATDLIINRLEKAGFISREQRYLDIFNGSLENKKLFLNSFFEEPDFTNFTKTDVKKDDNLSQNLKSLLSRISVKGISKATTSKIVDNLSFGSSPLIEAAKIHLFAQYWFKKERNEAELLEESNTLKALAIEYSEDGSNDSPIHKKFGYYKNNYLASYLRAKKQNNMEQYLGVDNLLRVTKGFPRHILTVLRNIYKTEVFAGRMPFTAPHQVSLKSQRLALLEAANWFYDECSREGSKGDLVTRVLSNLCEVFRIEMYADKPVECSATSFTVDESLLNDEQRQLIKWAVLIRVLIKGSERQEKNSQKLVARYHINNLLCPKWGLAISRRGALSFNELDIKAIFSDSKSEEYKRFIAHFSDSRNMPFKMKSKSQISMEF